MPGSSISVLSGTLELWLDELECHTLREGDGFWFESRHGHRWFNPLKKEAVLLWVNTPPKQLAGWAVFVLAVLVPTYALALPWLFVVAGAVLGVAVAVLSDRWTRAWQRELREGV